MSLVAVIERAGDQPGELPKTTVVPVGMPQDVSFAAYFSSAAALCFAPSVAASAVSGIMAMPWAGPEAIGSTLEHDGASLFGRASEVLRQTVQCDRTDSVRDPAGVTAPEDLLLDLARKLEPDGGMPGRDDFARFVHSLVAVLAFLIEGHTATAGAFRTHVQRLMRFLETSAFPALAAKDAQAVNEVLAWIKKGPKPSWQTSELLVWNEQEAWERIRQTMGSGRAV
jgi:hypothetical protein